MLDKMRENAQSWGIKILFGIIILAFIFAFGSPQDSGETVVAYVNGDPIGVDDFQKSLPRTANQNPDIKRSVLFQMVNELLFQQVARENGITVSDAELVRQINANPQFQTNGAFDLERYKTIMGGHPEDFEHRQRLNLLMGKVNRFAALPAMPSQEQVRGLFLWQNEQAVVEYGAVNPLNFLNQVEAHADEIKAYYEKNQAAFTQPAKADFQYVTFTPAALAPNQTVTEEEIQTYYDEVGQTLISEKRYQFRHLLLPMGPQPTQEDFNALQKKMEGIQKRLEQGDAFQDLAKEFALAEDPAPGQAIWMKPAEMPQPVANALTGLENGEVSQPLVTKAGLQLVQLVDKELPRPLTLEEARPIIQKQLAQEKASKVLGDKLEETISQMNQGVELDQIAENLNLSIGESGPLTREELVAEFGLSDEAADTLVTLMDGTTTKTPLRLGNGGYLVARKTAELPEVVMPMEQVSEQIAADIRRKKAAELAKEKAEEILVQASKGQEPDLGVLSVSMHRSEPFVRSGQLQGIQVDPALTNEAFTVQPGNWLPSVYTSSAGFVVARLVEKLPASEELWEQQREGWKDAAREIYRREVYQAMGNSLFERANNQGGIELIRPDLLN
ncbi:peptidyl-prolyl cis-trans isomerase D [Paucidesulfovibrio gracilis DSM 16080]|uniref:Periplasmic chaperone PpiD n=1 Tax=Paucidesulfovibrio gracilis DSM 16080 TaxID=1121449 RepID=A0A1T4X1R9_9BACT|nr:SurA N-terminal domain-containing protein [Paucidesulfovibrio gracilis]SKA83078.1 peptidyl-prolyl cis-trans isomerase D [Paucidesulfovibrio gracilis DSM 16080]